MRLGQHPNPNVLPASRRQIKRIPNMVADASLPPVQLTRIGIARKRNFRCDAGGTRAGELGYTFHHKIMEA
jgi:hypothetical protein